MAVDLGLVDDLNLVEAGDAPEASQALGGEPPVQEVVARVHVARVVYVDRCGVAVRARFGVTLPGGAGFRAIATLLDSRVDYQRMDALDVRELGERFDVVLCFGILHRVTDPIGLLHALTDVLTPGGEVVLETYGSRLPACGFTPSRWHRADGKSPGCRCPGTESRTRSACAGGAPMGSVSATIRSAVEGFGIG